MNSSKFYLPSTYINMEGDPNQMACTDITTISGSTLVANGLFDPYAMGYVEHDKMPWFCKIGRPVIDDNGFHVDYIQENHAWGYSNIDGIVTSNNTGYFAAAMKQDSTLLMQSQASYKHLRFINQARMSCINYQLLDTTSITISMTFFAVLTSEDDENKIFPYTDQNTKYKYIHNYRPTFTYGDIIGFVTNNGSLSFTVNSLLGDDRTFTFKKNDCNEYGLYKVKDSTETVTIYFTCNTFIGFPNVVRNAKSTNSAPTDPYFISVFECTLPEDENSALDNSIKAVVGMNGNDGMYGSPRIYYDWTAGTISGWNTAGWQMFDKYFIGYIPYSVSASEISQAYENGGASPYLSDAGIVGGKFIFSNSGGYPAAVDLFPVFRIEDLYYNFILNHKRMLLAWSTSNYYYYEMRTYHSKAYVSLFDENNVPLYESENGDYADDVFAAKLRDWQLPETDIAVNDFDVEQIPEYVPPLPGDDVLDPFSGDNIFFNLSNFGATRGFITHWVMTGAQVSAFGSYVWTNLLSFDNTDPDNPVPLAGVWENLKIATKTYFTTGSVDPASLMQLIIGLRFYPFDLENESTAHTDNKIYFGTGKFGVPVRGVGEYTRILDNMAFKLPSTAIVLPSASDFWYKDFRDYEGSSAMIYLPFCGTYQIPVAEIHPDTVFNVDYEVDLATGSCTAYVKAIHVKGTSTGPKGYPILIANGQCGFEVPLSSTNANRLNATIIGDVQKVIGAVAEPIDHAVNKVASGVTTALTAGAGDYGLSQGMGDMSFEGMASSVGSPLGVLGGSAALEAGGNLVNVASGMASRAAVSMPLLQGGRGWSALANPLVPYLQLRRGRYLYANGYDKSYGRPENRNKRVSQIKGYFECANVDMTGITATASEINMIKRMLETGVYRV